MKLLDFLTAGLAVQSSLDSIALKLALLGNLSTECQLRAGTAVVRAHLPRPLSLGSRLRERDLLPSFFL